MMRCLRCRIDIDIYRRQQAIVRYEGKDDMDDDDKMVRIVEWYTIRFCSSSSSSSSVS